MTEVLKDSTSHSPFFELVDSTTGLPKTAIVYTDVTGSYCRSRGARVAITPATLASASAAYSSGGFILVDDTNQPGVYRFDVPNAAFATGVEEVVVTVKATGCRTVSRAFTLTDISMQTATIPTDLQTIKTQSVTCAASVTVLASVGTAATSTAQTADIATLAGDTGVTLAKMIEMVSAFVAGKVSVSSSGGVSTYTYKKRNGTDDSFTAICSETDGTRNTTGTLS